MSEVPLYMYAPSVNSVSSREIEGAKRQTAQGHSPSLSHSLSTKPPAHLTRMVKGVIKYRGTSLIRNSPPPQDHHRALDIHLL